MSKIEWTGETWNPLIGCSKVSPGCKNCYAIRTAWIRMHNPKMAERYAGTVEKTAGGQLNWTGKVNMVQDALTKPLRTKKPTTFFVNSMSDLFHEDVPFGFIYSVFLVMQKTEQHTYQVLTKRPERMLEFLKKYAQIKEPLPNVWLGVSVENQAAADERIPLLLQVPAAVRFLSCEPLLGPVDLSVRHSLDGIAHMPLEAHINTIQFIDGLSWVICGGESGHGARAMHPDWARQLRDQCKDAGVPFFFKQWGEYRSIISISDKIPVNTQPDFWMDINGKTLTYEWEAMESNLKSDWTGFYRMGKKKAGRLLDGQLHDEFPKTNKEC